VGVDGNRNLIHDAFVVRYDADGGDELLHGVDHVIRERRYIIVVFCHIGPLPLRPRRNWNGGVDKEAKAGVVIGKNKKIR